MTNRGVPNPTLQYWWCRTHDDVAATFRTVGLQELPDRCKFGLGESLVADLQEWQNRPCEFKTFVMWHRSAEDSGNWVVMLTWMKGSPDGSE